MFRDGNRMAGTTMIWKSNFIQPARVGHKITVPFPRRVTIESIKSSAVIPQGK